MNLLSTQDSEPSYLVWWWCCWPLWLCQWFGPHWPPCGCRRSPWASHRLWRRCRTHPGSHWAGSGSWPSRVGGHHCRAGKLMGSVCLSVCYSPHTWCRRGWHRRSQSERRQLSRGCFLAGSPQRREPSQSSCSTPWWPQACQRPRWLLSGLHPVVVVVGGGGRHTGVRHYSHLLS